VTGRPEEEHKVVVRDRRRIDPVTGTAREPDPEPPTDGVGTEAVTPAGSPEPAGGTAAEVAAARAEVAERTADLQRVTAEYANYRKRVERDKAVVVETATGAVLSALLPVLDDIDRARTHGDLTGTFKGVADQLEATVEKLGLSAFGVVGDEFDPMLHEAVSHQTSGAGGVPTCVAVLRRGFKLGDRLLRPALVAVADPGDAAPGTPAEEAVSPTDLPGADAKPRPAGSAGNGGTAGGNGPSSGPAATGSSGSTAASASTSGAARVTAQTDASARRKGGAHRAPDDADDAEADPDGESPVEWFGAGEQAE
jgi:molecular chaperone GrpE